MPHHGREAGSGDPEVRGRGAGGELPPWGAGKVEAGGGGWFWAMKTNHPGHMQPHVHIQERGGCA